MRLSALAVIALSCAPALLLAQGTGDVIATVRSESGTPLAEAEVSMESQQILTDARGVARLSVPAGRHQLRVARIGFQPSTINLQVPAGGEVSVTVTLEPVPYRLDSVTVLSTRIGSTLEDVPLKVDVIAQEDVSEKVQSAPGSAVAVFREPNALLKVQTTAPSLGGVAVRIQGLRGRYTQILADGLPLYGRETGELSLVQIPPLDLGRVEIIRGAASALYGGQALGGVVNLFSREPARRHELLLAQNYRDATDLVGFAAGPLPAGSRWAYSMLAGGHRQRRRDLDEDGWTNLPGYRRIVLRPRLFWSDDTGSSLLLTAGTTLENREGGTVDGGLTPGGVPFAEAIDTRHFDLGINGQRVLGPGWTLSVRGAAIHEFQRQQIGRTTERNRVRTGFAEVALVRTDPTPTWRSASWVLGAALDAEGLRAIDVPRFDRTRGDAGCVRAVRPAVHPVAAHIHQCPARSLESRWHYPEPAPLGAGEGGPAAVGSAQRRHRVRGAHGSPGGNRGHGAQSGCGVGRLCGPSGPGARRSRSPGEFGGFELDATVFGSEIDHALQVMQVHPGLDPFGPPLRVVNALTPTRTWGTELFARWTRDPFLLTATYAYTRATEADPDAAPELGSRRPVSLTPKHVVTFDGIIEDEEVGQVALELSYVGRQALEEDPYRAVSRPYVIVGFLAMKRLGSGATVFLNAENLLNVRLSDYQPLVRPYPGPGGRWTVDAWAPLEGRVINLGVRLVLL